MIIFTRLSPGIDSGLPEGGRNVHFGKNRKSDKLNVFVFVDSGYTLSIRYSIVIVLVISDVSLIYIIRLISCRFIFKLLQNAYPEQGRIFKSGYIFN